MIDHYLAYVKGRRRVAIDREVFYGRHSRLCIDDWTKGFYEGHSQAAQFEARRWRGLQKDIEYYIEHGETPAWIVNGLVSRECTVKS